MTTAHPAHHDAADMFENVVAGTLTDVLDDQSGRDVIALAKHLVSDTGKLTLLHVHVVAAKPAPDSATVADAANCRQALRRLRELADQFWVDADVRWVESGSPRRGLHDMASREHADLLVVGASRGDANDRTFVADDTQEMLEGAPCAVAVAPAGFAAARAGAIRKIGVGFDGSPGSERAVALARRLAAERHAELSAFEVVPDPVYSRDPWDVRGDVDEQAAAARQRVEALGQLGSNAGVGEPVDELARYGQSVDLLVIGSHNYRPIDHLLGGSTAQRLADKVSSPLLVLPAGEAGGA